MRAFVPLLVALSLPLAATTAQADVYKWVDDSGVMHYSDKPPANPLNKAKVLAEDRVSTYQSDPTVMRSLAQTASQLHTDNLDRKVERLERELATQRQAMQQYASAGDAYQQCLAERRVDCDQVYGGGGYYYYGGGAGIGRGKFLRNPRVMPVSNLTGVTAGNVVTFRTPAAPPMARGVHFR